LPISKPLSVRKELKCEYGRQKTASRNDEQKKARKERDAGYYIENKEIINK
jgi:hypothetical protein